jgi:sporulation protein YlmC with PRC-barrel domain
MPDRNLDSPSEEGTVGRGRKKWRLRQDTEEQESLMLITARNAFGTMVKGANGCFGNLYDILFNGQSWKVQNLLINCNHWYSGQQVAIEPQTVEETNWQNQNMTVQLTKEQIAQVSNTQSKQTTTTAKTCQANQVTTTNVYGTGAFNTTTQYNANTVAHSTKLCTGMNVYGTNGMVGYVDDFVVDDETWTVAHLIVEVQNQYTSKRVMIETNSIKSVCWEDGQVQLSLSTQEICDLPTYEAGMLSEQATMVGSAN